MLRVGCKKRTIRLVKLMRQADISDFENIVELYKYVINHTSDMGKYARWVYGQHPTDEMIKEYIYKDAMYVLEEDGKLLAAMAVTLSQGDDYHSINWQQDLQDDEVAVVHILCVNPDYQKQKIGKRMIEEAIQLAKQTGKKAVRLDALESNTPAHKMYEALGFQCRGKLNLYAENTGWTNFLFFEFEGV